LKAQQAIDLFLGAHLILKQKPRPEFEYFVDFLNYAYLKKKVPLVARYPKKGLMNFIENEFDLM
jgi:hypothetical protein